MLLIGLTGGIATGKSTVSKMLQDELKIPVIDADLIARQVVEPGKPAYKQIVQIFGREILLPDQTINRDALGKLIFNDADKRRQLNGAVHPAVFREMFRQILKCYIRGERIAVLDVPLLFEGGQLLRYLRRVVVVYCDEQAELQRLMARNSMSEADARSRMNAQMSIEEKRRRADIVIDNSGSLEATRNQVRAVFAELQTLWTIPSPAVLAASAVAVASGWYYFSRDAR
ncbi:dephospho-CoA kinase [Capsaspora owczarzaki ATCC 30864]|uniref:Dephospho-CoA kinase n=1 Tax=Capsaspora owczarzaki (strain ATCC 30864) TaxID=595528 RepID=A0A0D2VY29_CAPO3|nr:dephospho-CoA kinase [Capsaspora owczarzaki ATCC 30864]KJE96577.1 dephospho-CoA kinase [Capsaspora owczarzaki ATCC 30864]|eukprot:XP_004344501.1 dephospho-CoA kinase [Capsaspora owczarzaki ATCC 30864]